MKPLHHLDNVFYPLGGMGYLIHDLADLYKHKIVGKRKIRLCFSAQPNSHPHLGTVLTIMVLYAIGEYLQSRLNIPVYVQFDKGEHCLGEKKEVNGVIFSKRLQDTQIHGIPKADYYMKSFQEIFDRLSDKTSIPYQIKSYEQFQSDPIVRKVLLQILLNKDRFIPILSPSTNRLHLRVPCPVCKFADKHAKNQSLQVINSQSVKVINQCFDHGTHEIVIKANNKKYFEVNTALYDLLLGAYFVETDQAEKTLTIMVDGGDYAGVWSMLMHGEALIQLGYQTIPNRLFAPLILDWSGAKFSKSLYVRHQAYDHLPKGLVDFSYFQECYGKAGFERLWLEAKDWARSPSKFFRNYSVDYFRLILGDGKEQMNAKKTKENSDPS